MNSLKTYRSRFLLLLAAIALLHSRAALAVTITVNSAADPAGFNYFITIPQLGATITLRDAVNAARNSGGTNTITFAPSLAGQTIYLTQESPSTQGALALLQGGAPAYNLTIQGLTGNSGVTIARASNAPPMTLLVCANSNLTLTVNDLTFSGGDRTSGDRTGGAFIVLDGPTVSMNRCTLTGNKAELGGAIYVRDSTLNLTNCTIAGNTANQQGGGIYNYAGSLSLTHTTITDNYAFNQGGGLFSYFGGDVLVNTIAAGNRTFNSVGKEIYGNGAVSVSSSSHHNMIGDAASAGGLSNGVNGNIVGVQNLNLGTLAANGGPTQTIALLSGPATNAGVAMAGVTTDQRGVARPQYGVPDIGAYEYDGVNPSLVVSTTVEELNLNSDPHFGSGTSLREALVYAQSLGGVQTITFAAALAGQTITVANGWNDANDDTALRVNGNVTVDGGTGVTINLAAPVARRTFLNSGTLTLRNLTLSGGNLQGVSEGGALWSNGTTTLDKVQFTNNKAIYGGAVESAGTLTVRNCTFNGNSAQLDGGALHAGAGPSLTIDNSTFTGNSTGATASAIASGAQQNTYRYLTITNNSGGSGAIDVVQNAATMINSIVDGNNPDGIIQQNGGTLSGQSTNNILGSGSSGGLTNGVNGNLTNVPIAQLKLGALGDNGGATQTIALQPGSLAIDVGTAIASLTSDQRGTARPQGDAVDIGSFELVPSIQAGYPNVAPLGNTYQDVVHVFINSGNAGATIRYTLDGSTPSPASGLVYTGTFDLTRTATVQAIAYGKGWLPSPIQSVNYTVLTPLPYWRGYQGLAADGSQDLATPAGDGVANLLKYAFNMAPNFGDLLKSNVSVLQANGSAGLPYTEIDAQGRLTIEFVRRKASTNPGITYIVETGSDLTDLMPLSLAGASVVSIDSKFERVRITDPTVSTTRFGRVRIQSLGAYFNDFNAALGAATLRGSASYTNQAVQLTDTVGGQVGAVTFEGINLAPEVTGFSVKFNLQLGPTTSGVPADGASFAVGNLGLGPWGGGGPGGTHHIAVGFDTYENGGTGAIGIHLWLNGVHVAANATNPYTNGQFVPVEISYDAASGLTLRYNGVVIFNNTAISGFAFQATDKFGIGANTGGANERCLVDDVQIAPR